MRCNLKRERAEWLLLFLSFQKLLCLIDIWLVSSPETAVRWRAGWLRQAPPSWPVAAFSSWLIRLLVGVNLCWNLKWKMADTFADIRNNHGFCRVKLFSSLSFLTILSFCEFAISRSITRGNYRGATVVLGSTNTRGVRDYHRSFVWSAHHMPGFIGLISFSKVAFERGTLFISILKVRKPRPRCWLVCQGRTNGSKQSSDWSLAGWLPSEPWCEVPAVFLPPRDSCGQPLYEKSREDIFGF